MRWPWWKASGSVTKGVSLIASVGWGEMALVEG